MEVKKGIEHGRLGGGGKFYVFVAGRGYSKIQEMEDEINILEERQVTGETTATLSKIQTM